MAKTNAYLRNKEANRATPVLMFVSYDNLRLTKYPTGETINPTLWNETTQRAKESKKNFPTYPEFNARLNGLKSLAEDLLRRYKNDHNQTPPTVVELRQLLDKALKREPVPKLKPQPEPKPLDLFGFLDGLLEEYKTKLNERTAKPITATSRRVYQQTVRVLKEFKATHYKNRPFSFEQMDYYFYTQFQQYLIKRNYATNTIGKHLRTLKTFFIEARERGLMPQFSTKRFKAIRSNILE